MGIEFRGKEYKRDVKFGKRTVKDGEAVAIWNRYGEHREVIGPRLVRLFFSTIRFLDRKTAGPKEYLRVVLTNGTVEHIRGPVTLYENPVLHTSITIMQSITLLSPSDCLVVHRQSNTVFDKSEQPSGLSNESIQRVIIKGPTQYYPSPRETLMLASNVPSGLSKRGDSNEAYIFHTASRPWTAEFPFGSNQMKGTLTLAFRFTLADIEAMLDHTSDLMGDMYDAVTADVSNLSASITDVNSLDALSNFNFFPILLTRSAAMGVSMETVAFRGYEPSAENKRAEDGIQAMNSKIAKELLLAQQEEKRIAADISAKQARLAMENDLEEAILAGKQARLAAEQAFHQKQQECEEELQKRRVHAHLEYHQLVNDESLRVLQGLKDIGADITKILCEHSRATTGTSSTLSMGSCATQGGVTRDHQLNGRDALIATTPALNGWFSVPTATEDVAEVKNKAK